MSLDELKKSLGDSVFNEFKAEFIGSKLKKDTNNINTIDLINYLVSNQDFLIKYADTYLLCGSLKEEFKNALIKEYELILKLDEE